MKYKQCHGRAAATRHDNPPPPEVDRRADEELDRALDRARVSRRPFPIISAVVDGQRFVSVGNRKYGGRWESFVNFLDWYIQTLFGEDWFRRESEKAPAGLHPVLSWRAEMIAGCQRAAEEQGIAQGAIFETVMTGATQAYLGLAYNLYLLAEYAELKERLIARLRHPDQFHGAYYETFVEAWFILAGFELMLDDERNGCTDHGEFLARSRVSGRTYWVEAKSRANNDKGHLDISLQLRRALEKKDVVHDRIVMIDVNVPHEPTRSESEWKAELTRAIRSREADLIVNGATAPPAVVFATNFPFHHDLTAIAPVANMLLEGFKITDLGSAVRVGNTIEAFRLRLKYDDMHRLETAMEDYAVPSFFEPPDASLAGLDALGQRWKIGQYVGLPETHNPGLKGAKGFLIAAGVAEQERFVYLRFRLADGLVVQTRAPMGEVELENYRKMGPKTYFGGANILSPVDMFAFFHGLAAPMPRRMLLTTLTNDPGARASMLRCSSTRELRLLFAEREVRRTMGMNFVAVSALRPDVAAG